MKEGRSRRWLYLREKSRNREGTCGGLMIVQRCRALLSVHNVMNLCCPTIFAPTAAATGERPSSKKKKNRMIALREKARMPRAPVLSSCATAEGGEERGWTAKMAFSLEEAPCGPTTSVGGSTGFFTQAREDRQEKDHLAGSGPGRGREPLFLKRSCGYCVGALGGWGSNA